MPDLLTGYDLSNLTIGALGGHSALEISLGAKRQGLRSVVVARRDRARTYTHHLRFDQDREVGCVDHVIEVDSFEDILKPAIQDQLRALNTIFVQSRYFWVYFSDFAQVEHHFHVPIFGSRRLLRLEERTESPNQYDVLRTAHIRTPRIFPVPTLTQTGRDLSLPSALDPLPCLTLTKVPSAIRTYERENFIASTWAEWQRIAEQKITAGHITLQALQAATIEEFVLGSQVNFNFFYSPLSGRIELLGTDIRRQTNLDGYLRLPAAEQQKLSNLGIHPSHIEMGHIPATVKESTLEKAYTAAEKFVAACKAYDPAGIIGPFALQGAIETDGRGEELVVFDVSFRMPGSPCSSATPYSTYLFGRLVTMGERIAMEVKAGVMSKKLTHLIT